MTYHKIIPAAAAAMLLASTAFAAAQTLAYPRYDWNGNYIPAPPPTFGAGPGYAAPNYNGPGYGYYDTAPGWSCGGSGCTNYDNWDD